MVLCYEHTLLISLPFVGDTDKYVVTDEDTGERATVNKALSLSFDAPRSAKLLWIKKMWYRYTTEYYLAIKKNEIMPFPTT